MKQEIFNLLVQINRHGIDNSKWGLVQDISDTSTHFGTKDVLTLDGQWLYLYLSEDEADWTVVESPNTPASDFTLPLMDYLTQYDNEFLFLYKL